MEKEHLFSLWPPTPNHSNQLQALNNSTRFSKSYLQTICLAEILNLSQERDQHGGFCFRYTINSLHVLNSCRPGLGWITKPLETLCVCEWHVIAPQLYPSLLDFFPVPSSCLQLIKFSVCPFVPWSLTTAKASYSLFNTSEGQLTMSVFILSAKST